MSRQSAIYFTERNVHGALVIYGQIGIRQYYGYSKREAMKMYRNECKANAVFVNH